MASRWRRFRLRRKMQREIYGLIAAYPLLLHLANLGSAGAARMLTRLGNLERRYYAADAPRTKDRHHA